MPSDARRTPPQRYSANEAGRDHSAAYRRVRARILRDYPLCRYCLAEGRVTAATVVDHVVALALAGTNDPANLAPACVPCNAAKAVLEQRYLRRGYDPAYANHDPELGDWIRTGLASDPQPGA